MMEAVHCSSEYRAELTALGSPRTHWRLDLLEAEFETGRQERKGKGRAIVTEVDRRPRSGRRAILGSTG